MANEPPPDRFEHGVRLGCGSVFGLAFGIWTALRLSLLIESGLSLAAIVIASVVLSATLAAKYGDRFWKLAFEVFR
jgi:hypothetical protein